MPPSGTVTFLFTDIEGSTQLWEQHPQSMSVALARHDTILSEAVESHRGYVVKTTGDGLHASFGSTSDAIQAAADGQRALLAEPWPETGPLWVRMALHTGQAEWRDGDYYGPAVNRAARLMSLAAGGQILLSEVTAQLTRDQLPAGVSLDDLGRHRLRSLQRPERVFQLLHPDLPADFPPLPSMGVVPNNLPAQLTSFVGRGQEISEIGQLLSPSSQEEVRDTSGGARLVTLIGPGGTGKTRLSLQVAGKLLDRYPDGVWLVELAPVADPQLLVQTVATTLGLQEQAGRPLQAMLADYLRRRDVLLILDNCEHLIDACAHLADELLRACPKLRILASSREALGIGGERAFRVRSMALPAAQADLPSDELASYEAIRLFVERAEAVQSGFRLIASNAGPVLQICRRLDGIPLAIELAAARVRVLSPEQIANRLDDRFRLLTGGSRTALPRQRTLRALIDWSYDLLSEQECILLQRLSVFSGGWSLGAAEAVSGVEPIEPFEVLDLLEQLVNKSLVATEETEWGKRYRMLETIRQYTQEKLAESGEANELRARHLAYFVEHNSWASRAIMELSGVERARAWLMAEVDNLRAAQVWALEHDLPAALWLMSDLTFHWSRVMSAAEALRFLEKVLLLAESDPAFTSDDARPENQRLLASAYASAGMAYFALGLSQQSLDYSLRSADLAREVNDLDTVAVALQLATPASGALGDVDAARTWLEESLSLAAESDCLFTLAIGLVSSVGFPRSAEPQDLAEAWQRWERGMDMFRQSGELWGQGMGHMVAGQTQMMAGNLESARFHAEQSLEFYREAGASNMVVIPSSIMAELAWRQGDIDQSALLFHEAVRGQRDRGNNGAVAHCLECLAFISHAGARAAGDEGHTDHLVYAATLLGAAEAIRQRHNSPMTAGERPEYEKESAAIRDLAGKDAFQDAWQRGQAMDVDQAISFALDEQTM